MYGPDELVHPAGAETQSRYQVTPPASAPASAATGRRVPWRHLGIATSTVPARVSKSPLHQTHDHHRRQTLRSACNPELGLDGVADPVRPVSEPIRRRELGLA
jgi:hypothetical protein